MPRPKKTDKSLAEAGIGGFIEIHGGGKDNLTKGCVGLENKDMDHVYGLTEVGTPVTIVGAVSVENTILAEIKEVRKKWIEERSGWRSWLRRASFSACSITGYGIEIFVSGPRKEESASSRENGVKQLSSAKTRSSCRG